MSMSTHVVGFRPADEQWNKMKAVWDACEAVAQPVPKGVENFFNGEPPGDKPGMEVPLGDALVQWKNDYASGYQVDVSQLPEGVRFIRFYNSW